MYLLGSWPVGKVYVLLNGAHKHVAFSSIILRPQKPVFLLAPKSLATVCHLRFVWIERLPLLHFYGPTNEL